MSTKRAIGWLVPLILATVAGFSQSATGHRQKIEAIRVWLNDTANGDANTAAEHYTRALQLQPNDAEANIDLAKILMQENQIKKAEPLLKHAVELDPTNATAHFRLSTVYRQSGHIEEAKVELEAYQKYKKIKEKLQEIYQEMRKEKAKQPSDELDSHN